MSFTRTIENFRCEHCNFDVVGTGYTNHCPQCLWSKHVDVNPGDRAEMCGGMMEPIRIEGIVDKYRIVHRCDLCGALKRNKVTPGDDMKAVLDLGGKPFSDVVY